MLATNLHIHVRRLVKRRRLYICVWPRGITSRGVHFATNNKFAPLSSPLLDTTTWPSSSSHQLTSHPPVTHTLPSNSFPPLKLLLLRTSSCLLTFASQQQCSPQSPTPPFSLLSQLQLCLHCLRCPLPSSTQINTLHFRSAAKLPKLVTAAASEKKQTKYHTQLSSVGERERKKKLYKTTL